MEEVDMTEVLDSTTIDDLNDALDKIVELKEKGESIPGIEGEIVSINLSPFESTLFKVNYPGETEYKGIEVRFSDVESD